MIIDPNLSDEEKQNIMRQNGPEIKSFVVTIICELFEIIGYSVCPNNSGKKNKATALTKFKNKYTQYLKKLDTLKEQDRDLSEFAKVAIDSLITLKELQWHRKKICVNTLAPKALCDVEKDLGKVDKDKCLNPQTSHIANPLNTEAIQNETIIIGFRNDHGYKKYIKECRKFETDDHLIIQKINYFKKDPAMIRTKNVSV